jgi:2-dehydropantoate 2-reductase
MTADRLNVAVLGPGGVGGLLAALLARTGDSVLVLAGPDTAGVIARDGLRVESRKFGDFSASAQTSTRLDRPVDACFITVKATHLEEAVDRVPPSALGSGLVVPFLNGIDHVDVLRTIYPAASVVPATIRIETTRVGPGRIRQTSPFASIEIAATESNRDRVESIAEHLMAAGFDVRIRDDELAMLWDKFVLLAPIALVTTHERAPVGTIRTTRRADTLDLIGEYAAVAGAEGARIDREAAVRLVDSMPEAMESSMQRDQAAGRPLELDALGGALLRRAERAGIAAPVTRRLVAELESRNPSGGGTGS